MVLVPNDTHEDPQPIDLTTSGVIWAILLINADKTSINIETGKFM